MRTTALLLTTSLSLAAPVASGCDSAKHDTAVENDTDTDSDADDTAPDDTAPGLEPGDLLALMAAAEEVAWQGWPDALLVDAMGLNDDFSGSTRPEDFGSWYLMFCANDESGGSIEIGWTAADGFAEPYIHPEPYSGVRYEPIPRTLDLGPALDLAEAAGMSHPFTSVSVHTPESPEVDARYHLRHDGGWIFVDIATGATSEEQELTNRTKAATPSPSPGTIRAR